MSPHGGWGGWDVRSLPSIPSLWWGHPIFQPLCGIRELTGIWVGDLWHLLEIRSLHRSVHGGNSDLTFRCRCLCGVFFNPTTSAGALDSVVFFSAWFCASFCNLFIFLISSSAPAVSSKAQGKLTEGTELPLEPPLSCSVYRNLPVPSAHSALCLDRFTLWEVPL